MSIDPTRIPVLVGIGQSIEREGVTDAVDLASRAATAAFEDAPGLAEKIQRVTMVAVSFSPIGLAPATEVSERLKLGSVQCETSTPGGNSPQWLMNRACHEIARGELETTLIVGAEATRSMRLADPDSDFLRAATQDRSQEAGPRDDVVGASIRGMLGQAEVEANLLRPADTYPLFESALAAKLGSTLEESRQRIAAFMSRSSEVAAKNPFAWFQQVRSVQEIAEATPANRITAEPYTKCMNSFANVDQGSALLVTSLAIAKHAGLADQCVFAWSGATNTELVPAARSELGGSPAIRAAAKALFAAAGVGLDDIDFIDLYSCFPVAVEIGAARSPSACANPAGAVGSDTCRAMEASSRNIRWASTEASRRRRASCSPTLLRNKPRSWRLRSRSCRKPMRRPRSMAARSSTTARAIPRRLRSSQASRMGGAWSRSRMKRRCRGSLGGRSWARRFGSRAQTRRSTRYSLIYFR